MTPAGASLDYWSRSRAQAGDNPVDDGGDTGWTAAGRMLFTGPHQPSTTPSTRSDRLTHARDLGKRRPSPACTAPTKNSDSELSVLPYNDTVGNAPAVHDRPTLNRMTLETA